MFYASRMHLFLLSTVRSSSIKKPLDLIEVAEQQRGRSGGNKAQLSSIKRPLNWIEVA